VSELAAGRILNWTEGGAADVPSPVGGGGDWQRDHAKRRSAKWQGDYVPGDIWCVGADGDGDYIFQAGAEGAVRGWKKPGIDPEQRVSA